MSDYVRTTRETTFNGFDPVLTQALRVHADKLEITDLEASALMCCETTSTRKKRLFGKSETILTAAVITPQWLVWAVVQDDGIPAVVSARLDAIQVQDYERSDLYRLVQDTGLNISGLATSQGVPGTIFIGLDRGAAAHKFRTVLKEACARA